MLLYDLDANNDVESFSQKFDGGYVNSFGGHEAYSLKGKGGQKIWR
jgi:hypothetical protein